MLKKNSLFIVFAMLLSISSAHANSLIEKAKTLDVCSLVTYGHIQILEQKSKGVTAEEQIKKGKPKELIAPAYFASNNYGNGKAFHIALQNYARCTAKKTKEKQTTLPCTVLNAQKLSTIGYIEKKVPKRQLKSALKKKVEEEWLDVKLAQVNAMYKLHEKKGFDGLLQNSAYSVANCIDSMYGKLKTPN